MKRKASQFPAVPVPHGGASYNPDLGQYLSHLGAAHKVEEKKLKKEEKLVRELDAKFPDQEEAKKLESNWLIEMSGGLTGDGEGEVEKEEEVEDDVDDKAAPSLKKEKRKTKKQKRKAKEQRTIQQKLSKKKTAKQRALEFDRLKTIGKEISAHEQELAEKLAKKVGKKFLRGKKNTFFNFSSFCMSF